MARKDNTARWQGETLFVFISAANGQDRIDAGENLTEVIRGGWVCSEERARNVDHLVAVNPDGQVMKVARAKFDVSEKQPRAKRDVTLVWFTLTPAPEFKFLVGTRSPVKPPRNPIAYESTERILNGDAAIESDENSSRAVIKGFALDVTDDGTAYLSIPTGGRVVIESAG